MKTNLSGLSGIDAATYSHDNYTGYITLPIGDLNFMTMTDIKETPVYNPYKVFDPR